MPMYLTRSSYTPETWARLIDHPEDRRAAATQYIEAVGGKLHGFWYALGEHDGHNLWEAPDNVSMAAGPCGPATSYQRCCIAPTAKRPRIAPGPFRFPQW